MTLAELWGRLRAWSRRRALERELSGELEAHLALLARDLEDEGLPPVEARRQARRRLGNLTAIRETSREAWGFPAVDILLRDLRYAVRGLVRSPGFTVTVAVTLGLGIGANAAMFAVIDRLGVLSYNLSERRHELGVRVALGARPRHIVRVMVAPGMWYTVSGALVGLGLAAVGSRWLEPLLYRISGRDPVSYISVGGLLLAVGVAAGVILAVRALRTDPTRVLKAE